MRNVVYISGALFSAPDLVAARKFYEEIARTCEECDLQPYLPHRETDPKRNASAKPVDVFRRDFEMLNASDFIVAVVTHASSGMGAELGIAFSGKKRVVALHDSAQGVSRFLLGMLELAGTPAIAYESEPQALVLLRHELRRRR
jgi:nucleoside 2-deoxyribosyltransferase